MSEEFVAKLQAIDPAILTEIVQQDQLSSSFEITDWSVRRLSDKGVINPDGLWLFSGQGQDEQGVRPWSVVLKALTRRDEHLPEDDLWSWKREFSLARSRLLEQLPGPVKAPRFYAATEIPEGAWIWMEHVQDIRPGRWGLDDYEFAMRALGRWNGACLQHPLPLDAPWLARHHYRSWLSWLNVEQAWQAPLNQHVSSALRARYDQLWAEREALYAVIEKLPHVLAHCDGQRRNLMVRHGGDGRDELVLVDWAQIGLAPLGAELNWMMGAFLFTLEWPPTQLRELDRVAFPAYYSGLQASGWSGEEDLVRLGYVAYLAVYMGCIFPAFTDFWCSAENRNFALQITGSAEEALFWQGLPMLSYALDCADEARQLIDRLGF